MNKINNELSVIVFFALITGVTGLLSVIATNPSKINGNLITGSYQQDYEDEFIKKMPFYENAREIYTAFKLTIFNQATPEVFLTNQNWLFTVEDFIKPKTELVLSNEIVEVRDILFKQEINLIPLIIPDKARVYSDYLPRRRDEDIELRYARILEVLGQIGLPAIDLEQALFNGRMEADTFMRTDTHWSVHGAEIAANTLAKATGILASGTANFETNYSLKVPFDGDLLPFVDTGLLDNLVGIERETIAVPLTTSTSNQADLFGNSEIGIVLIGTSYSKRAEFNFSGFLQQATKLNVVNASIEGLGPFQPMRDAIDNDLFEEVNPQFVVWEIPERYILSETIK